MAVEHLWPDWWCVIRLEQAPDLREEMLNLLKKEYISGSREGVHLTSLIYCLTKTFWEETDPLPPSEDEVLLWSIGFGLERVLIKGMEQTPQRLDDTGKCWDCGHNRLEHHEDGWNNHCRFVACSCQCYIPDGIWVSPDFYLHGPSDLKTTRLAPDKSAGCLQCGEPYTGHTKAKMGHTYEKNPEKVPFELPEGWVKQFEGYSEAERRTHPLALALYGRDREFPFNVAILHLVQPELQVLRAWFTAEELADNWAWVLERRETLRRMRATNKPEPFLHNEKWECENCRYLMRCQLTASLEGKSA